MAAGYRAFGYRHRALTPDQELAVKSARRAGVKPGVLATAYGVDLRTIQRAVRRAERKRYEVRVADRRATFEVEDGTPIQVTPWVPA